MSVRLRRFDLGEFGKDDPRTQLMNNEREDGEVDEGRGEKREGKVRIKESEKGIIS